MACFRPDIPQREGQIATKQKLFRPCPAWALICAEGNADEITDKFTSELVRAKRVKREALNTPETAEREEQETEAEKRPRDARSISTKLLKEGRNI